MWKPETTPTESSLCTGTAINDCLYSVVRNWADLVNCMFQLAEELYDQGELTDGYKNVVCVLNLLVLGLPPLFFHF